ncbi:uncharacterized protein LOC119570466 [Penaeus monodon]|uniref:uncharacterized protein LOC119570466 n=1 Tax=Penaeus monodon TaxID=6687 RepID=UPI0018A7CBC7|nr:uncharacterized protein LOC119570466 [Penaeus monodon]
MPALNGEDGVSPAPRLRRQAGALGLLRPRCGDLPAGGFSCLARQAPPLAGPFWACPGRPSCLGLGTLHPPSICDRPFVVPCNPLAPRPCTAPRLLWERGASDTRSCQSGQTCSCSPGPLLGRPATRPAPRLSAAGRRPQLAPAGYLTPDGVSTTANRAAPGIPGPKSPPHFSKDVKISSFR